jgi:NAD(P)-dependent dehydrogenase (short-subunit alcohol dehydrogenase family)
MARAWSVVDIPELSPDFVTVVTGANTGIGYETAKEIAAKGGRVIVTCRDTAKGEATVAKIKQDINKADAPVDYIVMELSDLDSVRTAASDLRKKTNKIDVLINNAGVMVPPYTLSKQGYELQIAVNHFGPFLFTALVFPLVVASPKSRIIAISSVAARGPWSFVFDDYAFEYRWYLMGWPAYCQSKLANQLFTLGLQRRLESAKLSHVIAVAAHPGMTDTDLTRSIMWSNRWLGMAANQGALPTLRAAFDPEVEGGSYYGPNGFQQIKGDPIKIDPVSAAKVVEVQDRLWKDSEAITGVKFEPHS